MNSSGQIFGDFKRVESTGIVPHEIISTATEKYNTTLKSNADKLLEDEFILSTSFFLNDLLKSGKVTFNNDLTKYIKRVAKVILGEDKKLSESISVYVLNSNAVNAFATHQGALFFTTGLLSRLENEAQLAFIIAHEVSHFTEKHVRNNYLKKRSEENRRKNDHNLSYDNQIAKLNIYAKENELVADAKAIQLYLKTDYNVEELKKCFDVLSRSHLPFGNKVFNLDFLNRPNLQIPESLFNDSTNAIKIDNESESTSHPNINARKRNINDYLKYTNHTGSYDFIISEEAFKSVQLQSRYETIRINLRDRRYVNALYNIFLLEESEIANRYLSLSKVKALYGLMKYKNYDKLSEVSVYSEYVQGESSSLHAFFETITKDQLIVLTYRTCSDYSKIFNADPIFLKYLKDIHKEMAINADFFPEGLTNVPMDDDFTDDYFHLYGHYDLVNEENLVESLSNLIYLNAQELKQTKKINQDSLKNEAIHLGINKVVVVNPFYQSYNRHYENEYLTSEQIEIDLNSIYTKKYRKLDIDATLLSFSSIDSMDVQTYNELATIYDWLTECIYHQLQFDMIYSAYDLMQPISERHDTYHYLFTGAISTKHKFKYTSADLSLALSVIPIPFIVVYKSVKHHYHDVFAIAIDAENNKIEFVQNDRVNLRQMKKTIELFYSEVLYHLSSTKV